MLCVRSGRGFVKAGPLRDVSFGIVFSLLTVAGCASPSTDTITVRPLVREAVEQFVENIESKGGAAVEVVAGLSASLSVQGGLSVEIPGDAVPAVANDGAIVLYAIRVPNLPELETTTVVAGEAFDISLMLIPGYHRIQPKGTVKIDLSYATEVTEDDMQEFLQIGHYSNGNWSVLGDSSVDYGKQTISGMTNDFGASDENKFGFALLQTSSRDLFVPLLWQINVSVNITLPPTTIINNAPTAITANRFAEFSFTAGHREVYGWFECRIDGDVWFGCGSPHKVYDLSYGEHTFEVRSVDLNGNKDPSPASWQWTITKGRSTHWVSIPAGTFSMGDFFGEGDSFERPVHNVQVSGFEMYSRLVTNGEYRWCVDTYNCVEPSSYDSVSRQNYYTDSAFNEYPVVNIDWYKASTFCAWVGGRLPMEAEWEYAARGGQTGKRFPWGDDVNCSRANYQSNVSDSYDNESSTGFCVGDTTKVDSYAPNGFGLFDMAGNVWQWVFDWHETYSASAVTDPQGPASGYAKVVRGGAFGLSGNMIRVASRFSSLPNREDNDVGFRCAR